MIADTLSRRYSRALFRAARKRNLVEEIYSDLELFCNMIRKNENFRYFYFSPRIDINEKKGALEKIFKGKFYDEFLNFLFILLDKKRQTIILRLEKEYKTLVDNFHNRSEVLIISSYNLDKAELKKIEITLSKFLKKDIKLIESVDSSILGGLILRINNKVFDASLEGQINRLRKKLLE